MTPTTPAQTRAKHANKPLTAALAAWLIAAVTLPLRTDAAGVAPAAIGGPQPNLIGNTARPIRYRPDGADFVIDNGKETFNRPLYGGDTAFRVDGGDKPEFVLYLPGRGGNLRFGLATPHGVKWLHDAARIVTRYRPGELVYEISDPLLGANAVLKLELLALADTEGLIARIEGADVAPGVELVWAFGGVNGQRGVRDGDIGTERVPISEWFQLQAAFTDDNRIALGGDGFTLVAKAATIVGVAPAGASQSLADAAHWGDLAGLLGAGHATARQVVLGRVPVPSGAAAYLALQRVASQAPPAPELDTYRAVRKARRGGDQPATPRPLLPAFGAAQLPAQFAKTRAHFAALRAQVRIDTPDAYVNAAMGALNVAAEATWDGPQQAVMHGAVAWRTKLLGWRGPYWLDALGYADRARAHLRYWAAGQNTDPAPLSLPPADAAANLSRNEAALHSNGDLSNSHYDMNLVYIDALFRHLDWSGDLQLARELWPVIERHLAWEKRLFRRPFGPRKLPLYEGYAAIWASDSLYYNGGGAAHASAYNYHHNRMAARLAALIGRDPAPYAAEADAIGKAMRAYLWMPGAGAFAETKDLLGEQRVHPSAALWTYYHAIDSRLPTRQEAWRMATALARDLPRIPVHGPGVPGDAPYGLYATTNWLPYAWSINNVVMEENAHMALGLWQAGRRDEAFVLAKSAMLASMFIGVSPGNLGTLTYLDVYRRESQRDFADSAGVLSRTLVEGLFGITPDALAGELVLNPGFPAGWTRAAIEHPVLKFAFQRSGDTDLWTVAPADQRFKTTRLRVPAPRERVAGVDIDGVALAWSPVADAVGAPQIEIVLPGARAAAVRIRWAGAAIPAPDLAASGARFTRIRRGDMTWLQPGAAAAPAVAGTLPAAPLVRGRFEPVPMAASFNDRVTALFAKGKYLAPRSPYASLSLPTQGLGSWAGHVHDSAVLDDSGLRRAAARDGRLNTPAGLPFATPAAPDANNIVFTSLWDNYPKQASVPLKGRAARAHLLMAGTTNAMQSRFTNGEVIVTYADGSTARLALVNPDTWWPIEQDYFVDDYQFRVKGALPQRVDLKTGLVRMLDPKSGGGKAIDGGAATILVLPLDRRKELRSLTVRTTANDVVIGLMAVTLER